MVNLVNAYALAIDCDNNQIAASELAHYFGRIQLFWEDVSRDPIHCDTRRVEMESASQLRTGKRTTTKWTVLFVIPRGLNLNNASKSWQLPEQMSVIEDKLHIRLRTFDGFRAAYFGLHPGRFLASPDWPTRINAIAEGAGPPQDGLIVQRSMLLPEANQLADWHEFSGEHLIYRPQIRSEDRR